MTDDFKELREALEAGPTEGPWYIRTNRHTSTDGRPWGWLDAAPPGGPQRSIPGVSVTWTRGDKSEINADYIAAANPATIRSLLAELDEARRDAERYRWLKSCPLDWSIEHHRSGWSRRYAQQDVDAAIDAAMKEQQP